MAINYLNSVDLNKNYIDNAAIQNLGTEPTPDTPGQIYFNTTSQALKVTVQTGFDVGSETYAWEEVGSDSVVAGTGIVITPGTGADAGNSVITNSGLIDLNIYAGAQNWTITQTANSTLTFVGTANEIEVDSPTPGTVRIGLPDDVTIGNDLTVTNNLSVTVDATITGNVQVDGEIVQTSTGNENQFASPLNMGSNKVVDLANPTDAQDAATKAYVDTAVTGLLEYQGGYNASTNTPNLDTDISISSVGSGTGPFAGTVATTGGSGTGMTVYVETNPSGGLVLARVVSGGSGYAVSDVVAPTITNHTQQTVTVDSVPIDNIEKGWTYTITTGGYFYNELVAPGDVIIAEVNAPIEQDAWTKVQNNVDLASEVQVGIGNVVAGTSATITAPYSNGTATLDVVDSSGVQKGAVIVAPGSGISVAYSNGTATVSATANGARQDLLSTDSNVTRTEAGGLTTFALDVGAILGSTSALDVKAEIISAAGQTVYADITRSGTTLNVIFTGSVVDSAYQALLIDLA